MEILLGQAKINDRRIIQLLKKLTATELANIAEPCYAPPLKGPYHTLLNELKLSDKDIKDFTLRLYKNHPAKTWSTHNVPATNLLIFLANYFMRKRNSEMVTMTITYLLVRYYGNLLSKYMPKYCQDGVFRYTIDTLTKTHLFVREGTISNGMIYLAKELVRRFIKPLRTLDPNGIAKFITEARHRMNQSFKSFAKSYHKAAAEGYAINVELTPEEGDESFVQKQFVDRVQRTVEETIRSLVVYKTVDRKAVDKARRFTKVQSSVAMSIVKELTNVKYSQEIKLILTLFTRELTSAKQLCGSEFLPYVKKLMSVKRTKAKVYFKQQVGLLLEKMLTNIGKKKWYDNLTPQTKFITVSFLATYLTMFMRNKVC